jgi:hypothetical protein
MAITVTIDGSSHTGMYQAQCDCSDRWTGRAQALGAFEWNPATPIAEAAVHYKMDHSDTTLDLRLTERFRDWLAHYWERQASRDEREALRLARRGSARP